MDFVTISQRRYFVLTDSFCDQHGNVNAELLVSRGQMTFSETLIGMRVEFRMVYASAEALRKILEMGFAEGITICLDQLESVLDELEHGSST